MDEKIKINVTTHTADILLKDTESFEFYKNDGRTLNKNAFITQLIVNYHDSFLEKENAQFDYLKKTINASAHINKSDLNRLCYEIVGRFNKEIAAPNKEKFDKTISVKPTKESQPIIDYVEEYMLAGCSLSEYFRNMFSFYVSLPQDEREKIIFKPQYDAVIRAVKQRKKIFFTIKNSPLKRHEAAPFAIACSKEEMHCYLLAGVDNSCMTFRLSRIASVVVLNEDAVFTDKQKELFQKMLAYGPQFSYGRDEGEIKVQLTARGVEKFKKLYVHRPVPVKIDNNDYYFCCSYNQIMQYFVRFGKDADVVYPQKVRDNLLYFHKDALRRYERKKFNRSGLK